MYFKLFLLSVVSIQCCSSHSPTEGKTDNANKPNTAKELHYVQEIEVPDGYKRITEDSNAFSFYLQHIGLKKKKTVYLFNGSPKGNQSAQYAVLDISVGDKDLQQCADAVMRLRAEYWFKQKKYDSIVFWDNEKKEYRFTEPYTRERFNSYLQRVFGMCGSASLAMQLKSKGNLQTIKAGDVFIKGGFPGHAAIVIDIAENNNGERIFMLAQSYMPAQDIHILKNPNNTDMSPWYSVNEIGDFLYTPEFIFTNNQLKTW